MSTPISEQPQENLPTLNLLQQAGNIIAQLKPVILHRLGYLAIADTTHSDPAYIEGLLDTVESIQSSLGSIALAVNELAAIDATSDEQSSAPQHTEEPQDQPETPTPESLTELEAEIFGFVKTGVDFRMEDLRKAIPALSAMNAKEFSQFRKAFPGVREKMLTILQQNDAKAEWTEAGQTRGKRYRLTGSTVPLPGDSLPHETPSADKSVATKTPVTSEQQPDATESTEVDIPENIPLSPNERLVLQKALDYLKNFEERKPLRDIVSEVFGRSSLRKKEEARLIQLFDQCVDAGIMRVYGKSYGYKTAAERRAADHGLDIPSPNEDTLQEDDLALLKYITINAQNGEVNIGQIVRDFTGTERLPKADFDSFIARLNRLADEGYLTHAQGSPWYGSRLNLPTPLDKKPMEFVPLPSITTLVKDGAPTHTQREPNATPEEPKPVTQPEQIAENTIELTPATHDLNKRELAMLERMTAVARDGEWFQQKQIDFSEIAFTSEGARRQAFSKLTLKLIEAGILDAEGLKGGRKYRFLPVDNATPTTDIQAPTAESEPQEDEPQIADEAPIIRTQREPQERALTPREANAQLRRAAAFAGKLARHVTHELDTTPDRRERMAVVSKNIAQVLDISEASARTAVNDLVTAGYIYKNGSVRGSRVLTLDPPEQVPTQKAETSKQKSTRELADTWTPQDVDTVIAICQKLLTLRHVQQGFVINKLISELGVSEEDEAAFRQSMRRAERAGIIMIHKNANPNTRSDHSKKLYLPMIKFPSQKAKELWKQNPDQAIAQLRALVS